MGYEIYGISASAKISLGGTLAGTRPRIPSAKAGLRYSSRIGSYYAKLVRHHLTLGCRGMPHYPTIIKSFSYESKMSLRVGRHLAVFPIPADLAMEGNKNMSLLTVVDHASVPESKLLRLAREGNEEAFTELVRRHSSIIYRISKRVLKNHEDAEDTLQNVLVKVHQHLDHFDGRSRFSTWLFRITFNEALITLRRNRSRHRGRCVEIPAVDDRAYGISNLPDLHESSERKYINRELALKAVLRLNPVLRCAFLLNKWEGWTHGQMADVFGISVQTAKSRVFRARRQLREELEVLSR